MGDEGGTRRRDGAPSGDAAVDPWPDPLTPAGADRDGATGDRAADADAPPSAGWGGDGPWSLRALILGVAVVALGVDLARRAAAAGPDVGWVGIAREWASTGAAFVLAPALLAWLVARRRPATSWGRVMAGITIALLLVSTLLGEAALCVLIASPLVYGAAALVQVVVRRLGAGPGAVALVLLVPLAQLGAGDPVQEVTVTRVVAAPHADVAAAVADGPRLEPARRPWLLTVGYPVPEAPTASTVGGRTWWTWSYGAGRTRFEVTPRYGGWRYRVVEDTAMRRWFAWRDADLDARPVPGGTELALTMRFEPALGPAWWFGSVERAFLSAAGDHLLDGLDLTARDVAVAP